MKFLIILLAAVSLGALVYWTKDGADDGSHNTQTRRATSSVAGAVVRVVDGDTVEVAGERLRLQGWDTPEMFGSEVCVQERILGEQARQRAKSLIGAAREFKFKRVGQDAYGRTLSSWEIDGNDFGGLMASEGLAKRWRFGRQSKPNWCD